MLFICAEQSQLIGYIVVIGIGLAQVFVHAVVSLFDVIRLVALKAGAICAAYDLAEPARVYAVKQPFTHIHPARRRENDSRSILIKGFIERIIPIVRAFVLYCAAAAVKEGMGRPVQTGHVVFRDGSKACKQQLVRIGNDSSLILLSLYGGNGHRIPCKRAGHS